MRRVYPLLTLAVLTQTLPMMAEATPIAVSGDDASMAFDSTPADDMQLSGVVGQRLVSYKDRVRPMTDSDMLPMLQQFGHISRISLDNWWAKTGAALIANNVLLAR